MSASTFSRRQILTAGAAATAASVALRPSAAAARELKGAVDDPWLPHQADAPAPLEKAGYVFFTPKEAAFIEAATERLIPEDDLGPGAKACNVPLFIDHQLAGAYGRAGAWYMQGPWAKGEDTQGFQSRMPPAALYRVAIEAVDQRAMSSRGGKLFADLEGDAQDAMLSDLEAGKIDLGGADAKTFFKMLWQNTKEGMFSDPIYGGNKDMAGWKLIGFPGVRYDFRDVIDNPNKPYTLPPVSMQGQPAWGVR